MSREFLVTKFKCAACGGMLKLSYEALKTGSDYSEGEPTGAAMVQQIVAVEPCFQCTKPAREVSQALNTLIKHGAAK
jgi:hypothetical protein